MSIKLQANRRLVLLDELADWQLSAVSVGVSSLQFSLQFSLICFLFQFCAL